MNRVEYTAPSAGKRKGVYEFRPIPGAEGYKINELGNCIGPEGYVLKPRWYQGKPFVKIHGKERLVWSLLVACGWQPFYDPVRVTAGW